MNNLRGLLLGTSTSTLRGLFISLKNVYGLSTGAHGILCDYHGGNVLTVRNLKHNWLQNTLHHGA